MQNDPLLALEQESRKLDRAFDRAIARRNVDEVMRVYYARSAIDRVRETIEPVTTKGTIAALAEACVILDIYTQVQRPAMERLKSILRRFERNERRPKDLSNLRKWLELTRAMYADRDPDDVLARVQLLFDKAIRGAAAPVLAS